MKMKGKKYTGFVFSDMEERLRTRDVSYLKMTLDHIKKVESDPSIIGVSNHLMAVGKKYKIIIYSS